MSLPFENALQRERERQRRQREGGQHTELSTRLNTSTLSPSDVDLPLALPPCKSVKKKIVLSPNVMFDKELARRRALRL